MSLLNVGARALLANQVALQTVGHNIANVNTAGYSRQNTVQQTVLGQYTGAGYIGQGVDVQSILRNQNELLTRQASSAAAVGAGDTVRLSRLQQLQDVFSGGASGLGAAINDMMNAFSDVVNSPTDLTARSLVLARIDETSTRISGASTRLDEISSTVAAQLGSSVRMINQLAQNIAGLNEQITRAVGNGQPPNDLLDRRDQMIRDLNQHVQTSQVAADDGSVSIFVAGSQPLVLGNTAGSVSIGEAQTFGAAGGQLRLFFQQPGASLKVELGESALGGGEVAGLLRFHNNDLAEGQQLLNRMAAGISLALNEQNQLGLTLDGAPGKSLLTDIVLQPSVAAGTNTSAATLGLTLSDRTKLSAASFVVAFSSAGTGTITSRPGGVPEAFGGPSPQPTLVGFFAARGLTATLAGTPNANDQFLIDPLKGAAGKMKAQQFSPNKLAASNPLNAAMGPANAGSLQLASLKATGSATAFDPPAIPGGITMTFTAGPPLQYSATGTTASGAAIAQSGPYTPGTPITFAQGFEITLSGTPKTGDTVQLGNALDPQYGDIYQRNAGNAGALLALRDQAMFDGAALTDGFADAMAQIGTRTQSAQFASDLSSTMAINLERDRMSVSGVNLDEEAARLIQYQQAYQASAKMIQIAQSVFDTLLQTVAR